jgi:hypothetical protein
VAGIDIKEEAVMAAKRNEIDNVTFIAVKAEDALRELLPERARNGEKIVYIIDPLRRSLHRKALRQFGTLKSIAGEPHSPVHGSQSVLMVVSIFGNRSRLGRSFSSEWTGFCIRAGSSLSCQHIRCRPIEINTSKW